MIRLLPIAGLCFAANAFCAPSWVPLTVPGSTRYLVDSGSLRPGGDATTDIAVLAEFPQPLAAAFDARLHYRSTITGYRIDCANRYAWVLNVSYYASGDGRGRSLKHYAFSQPLRQDIVSWGSLDSVAAYACKNTDAGPAPPRLEDMRPTIIQDSRHSRYATGSQ
ncbi:surface-adhesin E family protein [Candidimonas nitroreducens]|uniref:Surface-adhesin protein E-like domain-containing protein n=1 Tax=Candidimonas nitroreducens TaxID=683354 RepID=A0A225MDH8_9BURK|nr:surface-adhesin E family protein [Candidimonas nitroreducens]OWT58293.1 hypothetical protein CEY11_14980 [Candidimonas nitroreducens]